MAKEDGELLRFLTSLRILVDGEATTCCKLCCGLQCLSSSTQSLGPLFPFLREQGVTVQKLQSGSREDIDRLCHACPMTLVQRMTLLGALENYCTQPLPSDPPCAPSHCPSCFPRVTATAGTSLLSSSSVTCASPVGAAALSRYPRASDDQGERPVESCSEGGGGFCPLSFAELDENARSIFRWSSTALRDAIFSMATSSSQQLRSMMFDAEQPFLSLTVMTSILVEQFGGTCAQASHLGEIWLHCFEKASHVKKDRTGRWRNVAHVSISRLLETLDTDVEGKRQLLRKIFSRVTFSSPWYILRSEVDEMRRSATRSEQEIRFIASVMDEQDVLGFDAFVSGVSANVTLLASYFALGVEAMSLDRIIIDLPTSTRRKAKKMGKSLHSSS